MVEILENERDERFQEEVNIAKQVAGPHHVSIDEDLHTISIFEGKFIVYTHFDLFEVHDPDYFDLAWNLATRYEQRFGGEYGIRKKY